MKKVFFILASVIFMMFMMPVESNAQNKALSKALKKEYKTKMKEYNKEGWKLFGSSRSLDVALLSHYEKLINLGENAYEIFGTAAITDSKHKNMLHQNAELNAFTKYVGQRREIVGRAISDIGLADEEKAEFEHFYAAYESKFQGEVKGELRESYALIREVSKDHVELQVFYIVDLDASTRAFEKAMSESDIAQKYAQKVSEFIKDSFKSK